MRKHQKKYLCLKLTGTPLRKADYFCLIATRPGVNSTNVLQKTTTDYRNHSVSEQSNNCRVAAWKNTGPRHLTDKPAGPNWLLSLEVKPSSISRLWLMALARKGVRALQTQKPRHIHRYTHVTRLQPDLPAEALSTSLLWPFTFKASNQITSQLHLTNGFSSRRRQWIISVCQSGTGQKQE